MHVGALGRDVIGRRSFTALVSAQPSHTRSFIPRRDSWTYCHLRYRNIASGACSVARRSWEPLKTVCTQLAAFIDVSPDILSKTFFFKSLHGIQSRGSPTQPLVPAMPWANNKQRLSSYTQRCSCAIFSFARGLAEGAQCECARITSSIAPVYQYSTCSPPPLAFSARAPTFPAGVVLGIALFRFCLAIVFWSAH